MKLKSSTHSGKIEDLIMQVILREKEKGNVEISKDCWFLLMLFPRNNSFNGPRKEDQGGQYEERQWNLNRWFIIMCNE